MSTKGRRFAPQAVMLQAGADGLADDPMSNLALGNRAIWRVAERLRGLAPRLLVLVLRSSRAKHHHQQSY